MTANPRRPGFRLPWLAEEEHAASGEATVVAPEPAFRTEASTEQAAQAAPEGEAEAPAPMPTDPPPTAHAPTAAPDTPAPDAAVATPQPSDDFMRELVSAMRGVADHARQTGLTELKDRAEEQVQRFEAASAERAAELHRVAEADIAGIGEWAKAEAERIRREAEARVAARRGQLDQQLAAETRRAERESDALRSQVAEYERELEAYYVQLSELSDPAAFAAAAKRIPSPPSLGGGIEMPALEAATTAEPASSTAAVTPSSTEVAAAPPAGEAAASPESPAAAAAVEESVASEAPAAEPTTSEPADAGNGKAPAHVMESAVNESAFAESAPAPEGEAARSEEQPGEGGAPEGAAPEGAASPEAPPEGATESAPETAAEGAAPDAGPAAEPVASQTTSIVVKGLASFGAITGFRQSLAALEGIDGVQLSLGPTGEFVYRATHAEGFDIEAAIGTLEGGTAQVSRDEDDTLRVVVSRTR